MQQKVTIVIPVYNGSDYLAQAIESVLAQTYGNIEVLVIDDGSTDAGATERIAARYVPKVRVLSKPNGGVASALNLAIREMSGDYLSWLSHDDLYIPDKVAVQMAALAALPAEERDLTIFYSDYAVFSDLPEAATPVSVAGIDSDGFRYWLALENRLHGCTLLVPRVAFEICGVFDERLRTTQDFDLWFRMAATFRFRHVPAVLVKARTHAGQGSILMADTALSECNALMIRFMAGLTSAELTAGGSRRASTAYVALTASFWRRGFDRAAADSMARLRQEWRRETAATVAQQAFALTCARMASRGLKLLRRVMPPQMRLRIRTLLGRGSSGRAAINQLEGVSLKDRFSAIYDRNIFGGRESRSGAGSDLSQTAIIRQEIPRILQQIGAKSFLDAPCGDWFWMQHVELGVDLYVGVDIVPALIAQNQMRHGAAGREFRCLNLTEDDLPQVDVIFSRDCLVHLTLQDAQRMLANFKRSGSVFLLTTTFTDCTKNAELSGANSFWRPLNMQGKPFAFPPPIMLLNEGCTEGNGRYASKSLALWRLDDLVV